MARGRPIGIRPGRSARSATSCGRGLDGSAGSAASARIDTVAAEAAVAPTTLYRLFASKDDLVAAYIERADRLYRRWFDETIEAAGADPRARILALFDALGEQVQPHQCRGCPFLMALAEFPDVELPAHRNAVTMKTWVRTRLGELATEFAKAEGIGGDSEPLADRLNLVMEGVYASAQALGADGPAARARSLAEAILDTHRG